MKNRLLWARVIGLSLLPAFWAVAASLAGFTTVAVAMLSATVVVPCAKTRKEYVQMTAGFTFGAIFGYFTNWLFDIMPGNSLVYVPIILVVVVAVMIIIQYYAADIANLFGWLASFSIMLALLGVTEKSQWNFMTFQLYIAMLVGIWFFAFAGGFLQSLIIGKQEVEK
ncbi:DUF1097 family protein [Hungatella hathewayi]|uniref:DUF1097 family protein n=1 Tax=Hungatella hathewayi TaxID=154046 RepID=UPI0006BF5A1F|nr:DUF1097 family protein [Hungatella hathewayi]CUP22722.1 Uncharacterised protein [Hungatella hathewayi]